MSVTATFLQIQRYINKLTGTSLLAITIEMAGYFFLDYLSQYAFPTILAFLLFVVLPIHFGSHESWTVARVRRYLAYIRNLYVYAILLYILLCIPFAYITFSAPNSPYNNSVADMRECAYRFEESECTTQSSSFYGKVRGVDRECFALAMCLRQPIFLLQIFFFFQELLTTFLSGQSSELFWFFTGTFVVWAMGSGWWDGPNASGPAASAPEAAAPPGPPGPPPPPTKATGAELPQNGLRTQLDRDRAPEVGDNLAPPAPNVDLTPPLFQDGGAAPQAIPHPVQAHPNPLAQHPIQDIPEIFQPGPPGAYRAGLPMLPMVGEGNEHQPQLQADANIEFVEDWFAPENPALNGVDAGIDRRNEAQSSAGGSQEETLEDLTRGQMEDLAEQGLEGVHAEIDRGNDVQSSAEVLEEEIIPVVEEVEQEVVEAPIQIIVEDTDA